ncbi:MAG: YigZ family protein [Phycisphaerales bacterium]|nr:YigZ family protein [Phycisphaerales bacterium]
MTDRYPIPRERVRVETRASNSRFIATIAPAATMPEAQAFLREIRAEMPDATHHVYAFRVGYGASVSEAMSDDGEPSGTSGPPALAVLRGADIGNVALVITRYFGGTKLGTGGLVHAYTEAAKAALAAVERVEKVQRVKLRVRFAYAVLERARRALVEHECLIEDEQFEADVTTTFSAPVDRLVEIERVLVNLTAGAARLERLHEGP